MTVNAYDKEDTIRVWAYFKVNAVYTDPTAITLKVKNAAGTTSTYTYALGEITKSSTGIYYKDISLTDDGIWYYRFIGTGTVAAAAEGSFEVRRSEF